jgi:mannose-1-phosphate guanylyltransferase/phosphomannomutase
MKAVVMAGGAGSRLRPLTTGRPKPMVPIVNKPCMAHILDLLKRHGITEAVVTVQYLSNVIQDYFGDGQGLGMNIYYSVEEIPLGTAGSVKKAQAYLDETFIVISGDAVTDFDLRRIIEFHRQKEALVTLTLYRVPNPLEYGVIITDEEGRIRQFLEKPSWGEVISDTVNTGIYVLEPQVLDYFEENVPFDFSKDLFPIVLERRDPLYGYVASGYWCDVGDIGEYMRASSEVLEGKVQVAELGQHIGGNIWCGADVEIAPDAQLYGPIYLGDEVKIKGGVLINGPTAIRDYTIVDNRARIDRCIIWRNSYIGEGAELRGAIVCRQCSLKSKAIVQEGAVIGDNSTVGEGAIVHSNLKIWPDKEIEAGAIVKSSIIWGDRGRRVLFGRYGVTGLVNVDLTPEFAAKLGAAFGATLPKGSTVTINREPHRSPRMIKRATISGLPSAGINVQDLRSMPIPVARYITRVSDAAGGVHTRLSPFDQRVVDIKFFDGRGLDLSKAAERNVERVFFREDFRRVYLDEIGAIDYAPQVVERYTQGFIEAVDVEAIQKAGFHIVVDYAYSPTSLVLPSILDALGCNVVALGANVDEFKTSILPKEFEAALGQLATICSALHADMGIRLDVGGEEIFIVDDKGHLLPDEEACAAMAALALRQARGGTIVVPVNQSNVFERIAAQHGGQVKRTKLDAQSLMEAASQEGIIMAGDGAGNFIFPQFQPAIDGMMATAKLLEFLATQQTKLSEVIASLPPLYVAKRKVSCPWEVKGTVMRLLNERYRDHHKELIDGIKVILNDEEWVLTLPDPDQPVFHVYAESNSEEQAEALADEYAHLVEELQKD